MKGWIDANLRKRPTKVGVLKFIMNWLNKEQKQTSGKAGNENVPSLSDPVMRERFSQFWEKYPRKIAQGAAEAAWANLSPDEELFGRIMDALCVSLYSQQWRENGGQYIPSPVKWINEKRWNDEMNIHLPEPPNEKRTYDIEAYEEMDFLEPFPEFGGDG